MASVWTWILVFLIAVPYAHCAPQIKIKEENQGQSFIENHNNLLEWLNFFDDYAATSTTPAPPGHKVPEKEIVESIATNSQPSISAGTRDGQTLKIQVPTFSESKTKSDFLGSESKPAIVKPVTADSEGSRSGQTLQSDSQESKKQGDSQGSKKQGDSQGSKKKPTLATLLNPRPVDSQGSKRAPKIEGTEGPRDGQSIGNPVPTFSETIPQNDSPQNIKPVNSKAQRSGQTLQNPNFMHPMPIKPGQTSGNPSNPERDGVYLSENSVESFMGPGPHNQHRREGQSFFPPPNQFRHQHSHFGPGFESMPPQMPFHPPENSSEPFTGPGPIENHGREAQSFYEPFNQFQYLHSPYGTGFEPMPYEIPFFLQPPFQYQNSFIGYPFLPVTPFDDEHLINYLFPKSTKHSSRAPNSLSRTCSNDELEDLIGQKMEKLTNTTNLPGFRCHTENNFYKPGRCVESTCAQVRFCGIVGHKIKGRCNGFKGNYDKLCCMP